MEDSDLADFRRAVRGHLADRPAVSQTTATIHRGIAREHGGAVADVEKACAVLVALGHFERLADPLGGPAQYFRITGPGILAHESGR